MVSVIKSKATSAAAAMGGVDAVLIAGGIGENSPEVRAEALKGLADEPWSWDRVLARRLFPERGRVPESWMRAYRRDWDTAEAGPMTRHRRVNAY